PVRADLRTYRLRANRPRPQGPHLHRATADPARVLDRPPRRDRGKRGNGHADPRTPSGRLHHRGKHPVERRPTIFTTPVRTLLHPLPHPPPARLRRHGPRPTRAHRRRPAPRPPIPLGALHRVRRLETGNHVTNNLSARLSALSDHEKENLLYAVM